MKASVPGLNEQHGTLESLLDSLPGDEQTRILRMTRIIEKVHFRASQGKFHETVDLLHIHQLELIDNHPETAAQLRVILGTLERTDIEPKPN